MIKVSGTKPEPSKSLIVSGGDDRQPDWRDRVREIVLPIYFDQRGTHFFDADGKMIAQIRGWGGLTSSGLSDDEAYKVQLANGLFIEKAVNEYADLKKQLAAVTAERDELKAVLDSARIIWIGEWQVVYIGLDGGLTAQIIGHDARPFVQTDGFKTVADAIRWLKEMTND